MKLPTAADLPQTYAFLQEQGRVPGIWRTTKGKPQGHHVVFAMTHGKEPAGLAVAEFVRNNPELLADDIDLTIAIGNNKAAAFCFGDEPKRFLDCDMNRMPAANLDGRARELIRARVLKAELGSVSHVLDIHSTDPESETAALVTDGAVADTAFLVNLLPAKTVYTNIVNVQANKGTKTRPHGAIYGARTALEFETGQHKSPTGIASAVRAFAAWGFALGILKGTRVEVEEPQAIYEVVDSIMAPDTTYKVASAELLKMYAPVKANDILLQTASGDQVLAPCDGLLIYAPDEVVLTKIDVASEIWFIVRKINEGMHNVVLPDWATSLS